MVRLPLRPFTVLGVSLLLNCGGFHTTPLPRQGTLPERQDLQIWMGARTVTLHAVRIGQDSLSGVPLRKAPGCDSCRVTFPLAAIDSVRKVSVDKAALTTVGILVGLAAAALIVWNASEAD